jgi:hypothetical protein
VPAPLRRRAIPADAAMEPITILFMGMSVMSFAKSMNVSGGASIVLDRVSPRLRSCG